MHFVFKYKQLKIMRNNENKEMVKNDQKTRKTRKPKEQSPSCGIFKRCLNLQNDLSNL